MSEGLELKFHTAPPLSFTPPPGTQTSDSQAQLIVPLLPKFIERNYIREIKTPQKLYFSRVFTRPKKNGSLRPIIDLSKLNKLLVIPRFHMETVANISNSLVAMLWGCTVDIRDAYLNVPLNWHYHKFFAFKIGNRIFVWQFLPFGLSTAPWTFTRVMRPIKCALRKQLVPLHSFLDDFIILGTSPKEIRISSRLLVETLKNLGFPINEEKTDLTPRQSLEYLGVWFDLKLQEFSIPEEKVLKIRGICQKAMSAPFMSRRELEGLVGTLNFAASYIHLGRLHLLPIMKWMNRHTVTATRDRAVPLDKKFRNILSVWQDRSFLENPVPMHSPVPDREIMTDASQTGWCGVLLPYKTWGLWPPELNQMSINWKELKTIQLTLQFFIEEVRHHTVLLWSDNTTAIACLKNQGTLYSDSLLALSKEILEFCSLQNIALVPRHLKGVLNVLADQGSRDLPIETEWTLDATTFTWVLQQMTRLPEVDLFATRDNAQLQTFVSPCPDNLAAGSDALTINWNRWNTIYLYPPTVILPRIIPLLEIFKGQGILIAPLCVASGWFQSLNRMCRGKIPLPLNLSLSQLTNRGIEFHPDPSTLNLHAWII